MKGKITLNVLAAMTLAVGALPLVIALPAQSAPTAPKARQSAYPKWYYYDQLGIREWNKGNKDRAINYFNQSYSLCQGEVRARGCNDNFTKRLATEVIRHQQYNLFMWNQPKQEQLAYASKTDLIMGTPSMMSQREKNRILIWLDGLESFAKKVLGPKHLEVQALERHRQSYLPPPEPKDQQAIENTRGQGWSTAAKPRWYRATNERDFSPETFFYKGTNPSKGGTTEELKKDPTRMPQAQVQKGFTYIAGEKIDLSKLKPPSNSKWGSSVTVGEDGKVNPNARPTAWGTDPVNDEKMRRTTQWGIHDEDMRNGGAREKRLKWGEGAAQDDKKEEERTWGSPTDEQQGLQLAK